MSKLIVTSYPLAAKGEKSILFESEADNHVHQVLFDALHSHFKSAIPAVLPTEGEVLNINVLEEIEGSSLPKIRHFSLLGTHDLALLDALEAAQEKIESLSSEWDLTQADDYEEVLNQLLRY